MRAGLAERGAAVWQANAPAYVAAIYTSSSHSLSAPSLRTPPVER